MDAEEISRLVQELRVSTEGLDKTVTVPREEAVAGQRRLSKVVVGKIFSKRATNRETLQSNLPRILRAKGHTEVEMVGQNLFVISFSLESDKNFALEEGPWHFYQDLMILKQSQPMQTPMEVEFDDITLWVQCHNIPLECMEPRIIERIGKQIGKVEDIDVGESGSCMGKFARVRVTRRIDEPLVKAVPVRCEGIEKEAIVLLQYERLPDFCFSCGRIGHIAKDCQDTAVDRHHTRFEGWLRAGRTFVGRREGAGGSRSGNNPSDSRDSMTGWLEGRGDRLGTSGASMEEESMGREEVEARAKLALDGANGVGDGGLSGSSNGVFMSEGDGAGHQASQEEEEGGGAWREGDLGV